jgi:cytochrome c553
MRNLYASTLQHSVLGLCFVFPMSANAAFTCNSTTGPASRVLASQCTQCHGSNTEDLGSYISGNGGDGPQVMHWQLQGYSDEQRCAIANYFSNLTAGSSTGGGGQTLLPPPGDN